MCQGSHRWLQLLIRVACVGLITLSTMAMLLIMYLQVGPPGRGVSGGERLLYSVILSAGVVILCAVLVPISNLVNVDPKRKHKVSEYLKAVAVAHGLLFLFRLYLEIA